MNNTGHALFDPTWNYADHFDIDADREHFMETAAMYKGRSLSTQRLRERVARLVDGEDLDFAQAGARVHISQSYAHRLYREWKAMQK